MICVALREYETACSLQPNELSAKNVTPVNKVESDAWVQVVVIGSVWPLDGATYRGLDKHHLIATHHRKLYELCYKFLNLH